MREQWMREQWMREQWMREQWSTCERYGHIYEWGTESLHATCADCGDTRELETINDAPTQ